MNKRDFLRTGALSLGALLISRKTKALEYYPASGKTEWAILYGTWCGTSRDAGVWISEGMDGIAQVFDVRENPDLSGYKHIVVGGSIRAGVTPTELQEYLTKHKDMLQNRIRGLFAVCGNMQKPATEKQYSQFIENHLAKLTGAAAVPSKVFLGRITWGLMEPNVREQMKSFPNIEEYDNLKRSECMDFGREVLHAVK
jgi:menaquinone-dependent protoporphyrinogen IX oxidase